MFLVAVEKVGSDFIPLGLLVLKTLHTDCTTPHSCVAPKLARRLIAS